MQYSFATAISTILLASTLTSAIVIPKPTINIQLKTGDGDASIQETIVVGSLQTKQTNGLVLGKAVNAEVVDAGFTCQMFSDAKGTKKLGSTFDSTTTASFTAASDGSTASQADDAVTLGSICCASTALFPSVCGKLGSSKNTFFDLRIQIDGGDELATQGEVLANGFPQKLEAPLIGEGALSVSIVQTPSNVECQAFYRHKKVGASFNKATEVDFPRAENIDAVACTQIL